MNTNAGDACAVCRDRPIVVHVEHCCLCALCFSAMARLVSRIPHRDTFDIADLIDSLRRESRTR